VISLTKQLRPDVKAKYRVTGIRYLHFSQAAWGKIDMTKLSLQQADDLVARGFPYLVAIVRRPRKAV
jgi:hypothetical protein